MCHLQVDSECTFGVLGPIYLPPHAVSIPRTEVPMESIIGVTVRRKETLSRKCENPVLYPSFGAFCCKARSTSEEFSSGDTSRYKELEENTQPHNSAKEKQDKQKKGDEERDEGDCFTCLCWGMELNCVALVEFIKVFDGNNSLRRRLFRVIAVNRQAGLNQVLVQALRAFHITKDPDQFYLTDLYSQDEDVLHDPAPVLSLHRKEGKRPATFLRFKY